MYMYRRINVLWYLFYTPKNAHGVIDARESSINNLQYNLTNEQGRVKELQQHMPSLETRLSAMVNEHTVTQTSLEEKTGLLQQARKNLKIAREKNNVRKQYTLYNYVYIIIII